MKNPWITFVKSYAQAHGLEYGDALKKAKAPYKQWKKHHEKVGGGFLDSINNFLYNTFAKPIGDAVRKRFKGY